MIIFKNIFRYFYFIKNQNVVLKKGHGHQEFVRKNNFRPMIQNSVGCRRSNFINALKFGRRLDFWV